MSDKTSMSALRTTWESAASGWAKWEDELSTNLVNVTETLLDQACVSAGMRVLDLACGAGNQTLAAAKRIGENGRVVASDISAEMLEHTRRNAERAGLNNVETLRSAAEELASMDPAFDAAISRLGLMLFASPQGALEGIQRVLKPGARFAALVFTTPGNNAFMSQPMAILLRHAGKQPPSPGQPGIFSLGGDGVLEALLLDSGLADTRVETVRAPLRLSSAVDALEMMQQAFGAYRAVIADLGDEEQANAWAEVRDCLKQFEDTGSFEAGFEFLIGSGARPTRG